MKSSHIDAVPNSLFNMTDLIDYLIRLECKVNAFPIHESWNDIGNPNDLEFCRQILIKAHI